MSNSDFRRLYPQLKRSIVAIVSRVSRNPEFPEIIGTGFIARADGVILTCKHVVDAIGIVPRAKAAPSGQLPVLIFYLHPVPDKGIAMIPMEIDGCAAVQIEGVQVNYWADDLDVGIVHANIINLPALQFQDRAVYEEGASVFLAGFPMGTRTLRAPGWLHQMSPTLQRGIISAVLPAPCVNPHALLLDCITERGASGSPVFDADNGTVVGMVYQILLERYAIQGGNVKLPYEVPTAHTLAIPGHILRDIVRDVEVDKLKWNKASPVQDFDEVISDLDKPGRLAVRMPKSQQIPPWVKPIPESEVEFPC